MSQATVAVGVLAVGVYLAVGVLVAVPFAWRGAARLDSRAEQATWGFRLAILPASVVLWPWCLSWWRRGGALAETNAHRRAAAVGSPAGTGEEE